MKKLLITYAGAEFLNSIFEHTPMRTFAEIEATLRMLPASKELADDMNKFRAEKFQEMAVLVPTGKKGSGGGKVKRHEMTPQIPEDKKEEYHAAFMEFVAQEVEFVLGEDDLEMLKTWVTPEWLIDRVERFKTAQGIDSITHMKVLMQVKQAIEEATDYVEEKAGEDVKA